MANIARPCKILSLLALLLVVLVSAYLLTRTKPPQPPAVGSELDVSSWEPETGVRTASLTGTWVCLAPQIWDKSHFL